MKKLSSGCISLRGGFLKLSICLHSSKHNRCGNEKEKFEISISQKHFSSFLVTQTQTIYSPEFSHSQKLYCNCFYLYYVSFVFEVNRVRFQYQAFGSNSFCLILSLSKRNSAFCVVDLGFSYYFVGALRHKTILHQTVTETMKYSFWSMLSSLNSRHVSYSFFTFLVTYMNCPSHALVISTEKICSEIVICSGCLIVVAFC